MSAPKPGDKVIWNGAQWYVGLVIDDQMAVLRPVEAHPRVPLSSIEVLPKPVYVNHDTTEYRNGDVVRSAGDGIYIYSSTRCHGWMDPDGRRIEDDDLPGPLTLLVRNGEAVA